MNNELHSKLEWRAMCLSMPQIKLLLAFFNRCVKDKQKGASNLIDKIDYYNDELKILTEKGRPDFDIT